MSKREEIKMLKERIHELEQQIENSQEIRSKYLQERGLKEAYINKNQVLASEIADLTTINRLLSQALCDKFYRGSAILYDEHNPKIVEVIKDGERLLDKPEKCRSIRFTWYSGEFPSIEIEE